MPYLDRLIIRSRSLGMTTSGRAVRSYSVKQSRDDDAEDDAESFRDHISELRRRKKRVDEKRRQHGSTFVDHMIVSVRGGTGGNGAAAFTPIKSSATGPPCGGNGGQGGAVFFTTSPHLTSLSTVPKRIRGGPGLNGSGAYKHGRRGTDTIIQLPIGTIVKELRRDDSEARLVEADAASGMEEEEQARLRRERWFVKHPTGEVGEEDYEDAEAVLYREHRIPSRRAMKAFAAGLPDPSHVNDPPIDLDIANQLAQPILLTSGGLGGLGNPHFFNSSNPHRAPRLASKGLIPPTITLSLELKLLADVGLVGFPNAGKSTILRALTGSKAEVAGYQFTTLNPQVGVVRVMDDGSWRGGLSEGGAILESWEEREREKKAMEDGGYAEATPTAVPKATSIEQLRFTMSDNPGLLPMASENYGLGHSFLRSIERSLALVYVLDLTSPSPHEDLVALRHELEAYKEGLAAKGKVVVVNKGDEVDEDVGRERIMHVKEAVKRLGNEGKVMEVVAVSAKYGLGLEQVVALLTKHVETARKEEEEMAV